MVTRKPVGSIDTSNVSRKADPPYPTSPRDTQTPATASSVYSPDLDTSASLDLIDVGRAQPRLRRDSDVSSHGTWDTDDEDKEADGFIEVPKPLRITPSKQNLAEKPAVERPAEVQKQEELPAILRPGPANPIASSSKSSPNQQVAAPALANPWVEEHSTGQSQSSTGSQSNNPFINKAKLANDPPATPPAPNAIVPPKLPPMPPQVPPVLPVELPTIRTPAEELSSLSLGPTSNAPNGAVVSGAPTQPPLMTENSNSSLYADSNGHASSSVVPPTPQQKWGDQVFYPPPPPGPPPSQQQRQQQSLIDHDVPIDAPLQAQSHFQPPLNTSRPSTTLPTSNTAATNQRDENYSIKHINWQDGSDSKVRTSPILTQNANGPCPLLALVNALVLTTPDSANTAFVETLRTREQISLGLLLDAVFDELISGRRGDTAAALPDVDELYSFLLALHTGMNVNPRFVAGNDPATRSNVGIAGGFEQTKEMRLYSTFNVPLIHGWLPERGSQAYQAFSRCAQSFEDAQNIQFAESELEDKLRNSGLTPQEQQLLQDIQTVKHFLTNWPTQLTDTGLEAISSTLKPGQFAILFRNDHFSTIYKEPKHGALMTLITDAGYSSHDEIVWESLVDVNGAASEMFSGDFRVVSHGPDPHLNQQSSGGGQDGWETVPSRQRPSHQQSDHFSAAAAGTQPSAPSLPGPRPPTLANTVSQPTDNTATHQRSRSEQEDHDLALALQLQEEEEAQQRQTEDRRRREQQLTEQFLSTPQSEARPPTIPPRRGGSRQTTSTRPPVNRPSDHDDDPDAPPTYEQSASDRPFREAGSTARPVAQTNPLNAYDALRRQQEAQNQQSAYAQQSASGAPYVVSSRQSFGRGGRRPQHAATAQDAEDRCAVM